METLELAARRLADELDADLLTVRGRGSLRKAKRVASRSHSGIAVVAFDDGIFIGRGRPRP